MAFQIGAQIFGHDEIAPAATTGLQAFFADVVQDAATTEACHLADFIDRVASLSDISLSLCFQGTTPLTKWGG